MPAKNKTPGLPAVQLETVHHAPGHLIRRLQQIAVGIFFEEMRPFDVTPMQYAALVAIQDRPGVDQRTLSKLVAIDRSTVGTMLRLMEQKDLITRTTPPRNQRIKELFITPIGRKVLRESGAALAKAQERILAPLAAAERGRFMEQLARLVDINNERSRAPLQVAKSKSMRRDGRGGPTG